MFGAYLLLLTEKLEMYDLVREVFMLQGVGNFQI